MSTKKTKTPPMMKVTGKSYASVSEIVRDTSDAETADHFDKYQSDRRVMNCLVVMRCAKGVSQVDLAARMGCGQSKVSKMESSADFDLSFGDIVKYASALGQSVRIAISRRRSKSAEHVPEVGGERQPMDSPTRARRSSTRRPVTA